MRKKCEKSLVVDLINLCNFYESKENLIGCFVELNSCGMMIK